MKNIYLFLVILLLAGFSQVASAQNISNEGSDFWIPFPTHDPSAGDLANMNIFVTCKTTSEVTVSCGTYTETKPIPANAIVTFSVPRAVSYISNTEGNVTLTNRGIHAVVTTGKPSVALYAHIYAGARSAASLILPKEALGQKYYSMNYTQDNVSNARNFLVLVAAEDNTNLIIHINATTTKLVNLPKAGDVYEYYPSTNIDLTGVFVEVDPANSLCKRFAAFSGSTSLVIGCTGSRDPLFQQLYTVSSWGKNYGIVPFINRKYILRILAQEDNTKVNVNGATITLNRGAFYETSQLTTAGKVTADKLISVAQYSLTQGCSSISGGNVIGDPDMVLLNPTEFNIKNITVFSSSNKAIINKYVNVFMKTAKTSTFKLNGALPSNGSWQTVPSDPSYSYIQIEVFVESLTLTATDGFNAIAYGFGIAESYAYSAGTNLASSQFLTLLNKTTNTENASACLGEASDFKLTLPYQLTKIIWKYTDGTPDFKDNAPNPTVTVVNGETLYTYTAPVNKIFTTPGPTQISAIATLVASAGSCSTSDVELIFNFSVDPLPDALFTLALTGCADSEISFTDASKSNVDGKSINNWMWDFGDGSPINSEQNPKHIYTTNGNYTVKLTVFAENGCASNVTTHDIFINPKAAASFESVKNTCIANENSFIDRSKVIGGSIIKWTWNFGDNSGISNEQNPKHTYATSGDFVVSLTIESDKGCISLPFNYTISVAKLPIVAFAVPDACATETIASFINSSTDFDNSTNGLNYIWDYGDPSSGVANTSSSVNGTHTYALPGDYVVTLTVTNANNCIVKISQPYKINPRIKSLFTVIQKTCTNIDNVFANQSTIEAGNIVKWIWDMGDGTTLTERTNGDPFNYKYSTSGTYQVALIIESDKGCKSLPYILAVTVNDIPINNFIIPDVCLADAQAIFANKSTDFDDSTSSLNYLWDFGDPSSGALNSSTVKDGAHKYNSSGTYTVTLTVTNVKGCKVTNSKPFTVNGSFPKAGYEIINPNSLCSNKTFSLKNTSTVDFGSITKVEWFIDGQKESEDLDPLPNKIYDFNYAQFTSPLSKTLVIKMVVYSGGTCTDEITQQVVLLASPVVKFNQLTSICLNGGTVQFVGTETGGLQGTATYTGAGISSSGFFNPKLAGVGVHTITYTFNATNGCADQKKQDIEVYPIPSVYAGPDFYILAGGEKQIDATASGNGLTFKWTPSNGLSRDDILNPTAMPEMDTKYTLTVTSAQNCASSSQINVYVLQGVNAPNSFTPNGDGINDVWNIKYLETYPNTSVEIFDRNGQRVYFSRGYAVPFDGNYKGQPLPVGTYYYIINPNSGRKSITGDLTIIR